MRIASWSFNRWLSILHCFFLIVQKPETKRWIVLIVFLSSQDIKTPNHQENCDDIKREVFTRHTYTHIQNFRWYYNYSLRVFISCFLQICTPYIYNNRIHTLKERESCFFLSFISPHILEFLLYSTSSSLFNSKFSNLLTLVFLILVFSSNCLFLIRRRILYVYLNKTHITSYTEGSK